MSGEALRAQVTVVGAGVTGLTAGALLARAGVGVVVLERSSSPGGRAASRVVDGYTFNLGVHALYTGGSASRTLQDLGVTYQSGSPTTVMGLRDGRFFPLPGTAGQMLRSGLFTVREKVSLLRFFAALGAAKPSRLGSVSLAAWLDANVRSPRVRQFAEALAFPLVYTSALDLVSADVFVDKVQRVLKHPVHYVDHGWQTLVDGLEAVARASGAHIRLGARVIGVDEPGANTRIVSLANGGIVETERIVLATARPHALQVLSTYSTGRRAIAGWQPTPAHVACLDVALAELPVPERTVVQDLQHPRFLTAQSVYSHVARQGTALVYTVKQLDPRVANHPAADEQDLEDLLEQAQPGWRAVLVHRQFLPHLEAVGALPTARTGGCSGRPPTTVPGDPDVYLAGDWVGDEGFLLDACTSSARHVARLCGPSLWSSLDGGGAL